MLVSRNMTSFSSYDAHEYSDYRFLTQARYSTKRLFMRKDGFTMKRIKGTLIRLGGLLASCALVLGVASTQAACIMIFHQPKIPQGMSRFVRAK